MRDEERQSYFKCPDELEASHETLTFGDKIMHFGRPGPSWLMSTFGIDRETAVKAFKLWKAQKGELLPPTNIKVL